MTSPVHVLGAGLHKVGVIEGVAQSLFDAAYTKHLSITVSLESPHPDVVIDHIQLAHLSTIVAAILTHEAFRAKVVRFRHRRQ
jgi:hypothetical protein